MNNKESEELKMIKVIPIEEPAKRGRPTKKKTLKFQIEIDNERDSAGLYWILRECKCVSGRINTLRRLLSIAASLYTFCQNVPPTSDDDPLFPDDDDEEAQEHDSPASTQADANDDQDLFD